MSYKPLVESLFLTRDQALSLWNGSTDSKILDYHRTNSRDESWTIKKAEHRIIDAFELWCWPPASAIRKRACVPGGALRLGIIWELGVTLGRHLGPKLNVALMSPKQSKAKSSAGS